MDESALKTLVAHLESLRTPLDHWLSIWTWLVVAGIAFELVTVIREYCDDRRAWRRAATQLTIPPPERPSRRWLLFDLVGVLIVVAGVAGELAVEARIAQNETALRNANGSLMLLLDQKAGDAAVSASNASVAAGEAESKADAADTVADNAVRKANTAATLAVRAGRAASDASAHAAEVDKYADLIAFKVSWRTIDEKKFHGLMAGKPIGTAEIWFEPDDEAFNFASQIARALKDAGWKVSDPEPMPKDRKWSPKPPMTVLDDLRQDASMNGLAIGSKHLTILGDRTAAGAFVGALGFSMGRAFSYIGGEYPSLPDNHVVVAVGRHIADVPPLNPYPQKTVKPESASPSEKNAKPPR